MFLANESRESISYHIRLIRDAFYKALPARPGNVGEETPFFYIIEVFDGHIIVESSTLPPETFYKVAYTRTDTNVTFAEQSTWEQVQLDYKPSISPEAQYFDDKDFKTERVRKDESIECVPEVLEELADGSIRIKIVGITADVVNGNNRVYPKHVLQEAIDYINETNQLSQSMGQGRIITLLGEDGHPSAKATKFPAYSETAYLWDKIALDPETGKTIVEGKILPTTKGKDMIILARNGVKIKFSQRAVATSFTKPDGVEEMTKVRINGYDSTPNPSDPNAGLIELIETKNEDESMTKEQFLQLLKDNPELLKGITLEEAKEFTDTQLKMQETIIRNTLGITAEEEIPVAMKRINDERIELAQMRLQKAINDKLESIREELVKKYSDKAEAFIAQVKAFNYTSVDQLDTVIEATTKTFDKFIADAVLAQRGMNTMKDITVTPAIESEAGVPEYAKASFEITESILARNPTNAGRTLKHFNPNKAQTVNDIFAREYLKLFDKKFAAKLQQESKMFADEATATADLNLPVSVNRALIALAVPQLIASSIFDTAVADSSPTTLYFDRALVAEVGLETAVAAEVIVLPNPLPGLVALAHQRIKEGTVVIAGNTEDTDFVVDYANGALWIMATFNNAPVAYTYYKVREGEMSEIERMKKVLDNKTISVKYDRLAAVIPHEAIQFSKSQLGLDLVSKTLGDLAFELNRIIDRGMLRKGLFSAKIVASNVSGSYSLATNLPKNMASFMKKAGGMIIKRYYSPDFHVMSYDNAMHLGDWDALTSAGARQDVRGASNGFVTMLANVPVFASTEMVDADILTGMRELVQYRVFEPMTLVDGGIMRHETSGKLIDAHEWFIREGNATESVIPEKSARTQVTA